MTIAPATRPRPLLFILVSILLVVSGVVFSRFGSGSEAESGRAGDAARVEVAEAGRVALETARLRAQVERAARHFVSPYLRYEVGDIDARVRRELRATATPEFAAALLAVPPRAPAERGFPPPARVQGFEINLSQSTAFHAFVDIAARRGAAAERFSFEFEYDDGGWRASGVTE